MESRDASPSPGRTRLLKSRRVWLQVALLGGIAALVVWRLDLGETWRVIRSVEPGWTAAGVLLLIGSNVAHAKKWQKLLSGLGHVPLREVFTIFWSSMTTNNVIPLRAGDVLRVQVMAQRTGIPRSGIVASLLTERVLDGGCFLVLIGTGVVLVGIRHSVSPLVIGLVVAFAALAVTTVIVARSRPGPELERSRLLRPLPSRLRRRVAEFIPHVVDGLRPLGTPRSGSVVAAWALVAWTMEAAAYVSWGYAFGLELNPGVYVLVMVATNIAGAITLLPANLGLYELTAVGVLKAAGASGDEATAFAVGTHILVIATISLVGLASLSYLRLSLEDVFYLRRRRARASPAGIQVQPKDISD